MHDKCYNIFSFWNLMLRQIVNRCRVTYLLNILLHVKPQFLKFIQTKQKGPLDFLVICYFLIHFNHQPVCFAFYLNIFPDIKGIFNDNIQMFVFKHYICFFIVLFTRFVCGIQRQENRYPAHSQVTATMCRLCVGHRCICEYTLTLKYSMKNNKYKP